MANFSLVKSFPQVETAQEFKKTMVSQGREMGIDVDPHLMDRFSGPLGVLGETYPDMPWEPKESFRAVAGYYAGH